jgi:hypothetical protein
MSNSKYIWPTETLPTHRVIDDFALECDPTEIIPAGTLAVVGKRIAFWVDYFSVVDSSPEILAHLEPLEKTSRVQQNQDQRIEEVISRVVNRTLCTTQNRGRNYLKSVDAREPVEVELEKPDGLVRTKAQWADAHWILTCMCREVLAEFLKEDKP